MQEGFRAAAYIPMVNSYIENESKKTLTELTEKYSRLRRGNVKLMLPEEPMTKQDVMAKITEFCAGSRKHYTDGGNVSGALYCSDDSHWEFIAEIMKKSIVSNPLFIDEFIWVTQLEAEIIRWTLDLYHGDKNACGIVT